MPHPPSNGRNGRKLTSWQYRTLLGQEAALAPVAKRSCKPQAVLSVTKLCATLGWLKPAQCQQRSAGAFASRSTRPARCRDTAATQLQTQGSFIAKRGCHDPGGPQKSWSYGGLNVVLVAGFDSYRTAQMPHMFYSWVALQIRRAGVVRGIYSVTTSCSKWPVEAVVAAVAARAVVVVIEQSCWAMGL